MSPDPIVVGLTWAARELGVRVETARALARRGELPGAFQIGTRWRVSTVVFRQGIEALARATLPAAIRTGEPAPRALQALDGGGRPSVPSRAPRRSEGLTGRRIAADAPRATITGDAVSLVRPRRRPQGPSS